MSTLGNRTKDYSSIKSSVFFKDSTSGSSGNALPSYGYPSSFTSSQLSNYFADTPSTTSSLPLSSTYNRTSTYNPISSYTSSSLSSTKYEDQKPMYRSIAMSKIGLQNLGNTCYMNTCLQNLIHTELFIERLFNSKDNINFQSPITKQFYDLCTSISSSSYSISPNDFKRSFGQRHTTFQGYGQHDTQEFCRVLLEDMSQELNKEKIKPKYVELKTDNMTKTQGSQAFNELFRKRENSIIIDTFYSQIINVFTCPCNYETYSFGKLLDIPLLLPSNDYSVTLDRLLDSYFETEMIQWETKCVKCNKKTVQQKRVSFSQLPDILILSFQRNNGRIKRKNNIEISFSEEINLRQYVDKECLMNEKTRYELYGVGNHSGSIDFGHYYAQIKIDGNWIEFNDSIVGKCFDFKRASSSAYVLFYRKL